MASIWSSPEAKFLVRGFQGCPRNLTTGEPPSPTKEQFNKKNWHGDNHVKFSNMLEVVHWRRLDHSVNSSH